MCSRISIALVSVLKPVNDTRFFEKFGFSLSQKNKYDVNIIGFAAKNVKKVWNVHFYPVFDFKRISFARLLAPVVILRYLLKVKPKVIIFNTPEILYVILVFKLLSRCRVIYDIQENYYRNIIFNKHYPPIVRRLLSFIIRAKEWSGYVFIDRIIFAEEGYQKEMLRWAQKAIVIRNTYNDLSYLAAELLPTDEKDVKKNQLTDLDKRKKSPENSGRETPPSFRSYLERLPSFGSVEEKPLSMESDEENQRSLGFENENHSSLGSGNKKDHPSLGSGPDRRPSAGFDRERPLTPGSDKENHLSSESGKKDHPSMGSGRENTPRIRPGLERPSSMEADSENHSTDDSRRKISILYSGTIAENYGIFRAVDFIDNFHLAYPDVRLLIIGYCARPVVLKKLLSLIESRDYIRLFGGDHLVPHEDIVRYIRMADFGLICYDINPSVENCFPTKIYEYMANKLPIIIQDFKPWSSFCLKHDAAVEIDFEKVEYKELYTHLTTRKFYRKGLPEEIFWKHEEKKLLEMIDNLRV